jgi:hypothetical protein
MTTLIRVSAAFLLAILVVACSSGAAPAASRAPSASGPPSTSGTPSGEARPSGPIDTPDEAAAAVIASDSRFRNVGEKDPDMIGQCCYYEAATGQDGFRVRITMGWGDCPAGCIESHVWTYQVSRDGAIALIGQSGDQVPPGGIGNS